jgi:hypothetical protein
MKQFEFCLFTNDVAFARQARAAGIDHLVIDWENQGKHDRQLGAQLESNQDTPEQLKRLQAEVPGSVLCRINGYGAGLREEVERAVQAGATVVFLPMVRQLEHVQEFLDLLAGRAEAAILVETAEGVLLAPHLARLPLSMVYVGLNDLALSRGTGLFEAVRDGTVERVRRHFEHCKFGFGGLTVADAGVPLPTRLLALEMSRLRCDFTFLRRSFKADVVDRDMRQEISRLRELLARSTGRGPQQVQADLQALHAAVDSTPVVLR